MDNECLKIRNLILDSDDFFASNLKTLPPEAKSHIENCPECRAYLEELKNLNALVNAATPVPVKDGYTLHEHIAERIKNGDVKIPGSKKRLRFPAATVAAVAAVVAITFVTKFPVTKFADDLGNEFSAYSDSSAADFEAIYESADGSAAITESQNNEKAAEDKNIAENDEEYEEYEENREYGERSSDSGSGANSGAASFKMNPPLHSQKPVYSQETVEESANTEEFERAEESKEIERDTCTNDSLSLGETAEQILLEADNYFKENPCENQEHQAEYHKITSEMIFAVGEENFVQWYKENKSLSLELEEFYNIDSFSAYFNLN